jgi:signal transduction histidine kinase
MSSVALLVCSADNLRILADSANDLLLHDNPEEVIDDICKKVSQHLGLEIYLVHLLDPDGSTLRVRFGTLSEFPHECGPSEGILCHCRAPGQPSTVVDACRHPDCPGCMRLEPLGIRAFACVPMGVHGVPVGRLLFGSRRRERLSTDELTLIQTVADQISMALERSRLNTQLRLQAKRLQQADRAKDLFLANVSHDLRTPLTSIIGYANVLKKKTCDPAKAAHAIDVIIRNAKAQAQLVNDLLDVSRILAGKLEINRKPIDLNPVIEAALDTIRPVVDAKSQRLQAKLHPSGAQIMGDSDRLQQVFWNLLSNSVKFVPEGGQINVHLEEGDRAFNIVVADTGIGIDGESLPHVFERFWQAEGAKVRGSTGLGLGLAIVQHLVELHGGMVTAESPGKNLGAKFTVSLPRHNGA